MSLTLGKYVSATLGVAGRAPPQSNQCRSDASSQERPAPSEAPSPVSALTERRPHSLARPLGTWCGQPKHPIYKGATGPPTTPREPDSCHRIRSPLENGVGCCCAAQRKSCG